MVGEADFEEDTISIHAPRVGCDNSVILSSDNDNLFQSTHPGWGATTDNVQPDRLQKRFQSTHPGWGATRALSLLIPVISNFNPRTPGGVRRDRYKQ